MKRKECVCGFVPKGETKQAQRSLWRHNQFCVAKQKIESLQAELDAVIKNHETEKNVLRDEIDRLRAHVTPGRTITNNNNLIDNSTTNTTNTNHLTMHITQIVSASVLDVGEESDARLSKQEVLSCMAQPENAILRIHEFMQKFPENQNVRRVRLGVTAHGDDPIWSARGLDYKFEVKNPRTGCDGQYRWLENTRGKMMSLPRTIAEKKRKRCETVIRDRLDQRESRPYDAWRESEPEWHQREIDALRASLSLLPM